MKSTFSVILILTSTLASAQLIPDYIFESGYENETTIVQFELNGNPNANSADIYGQDGNYNWVDDLDNNPSEIGDFSIFYQHGAPDSALADLVEDPTDQDNQVLMFQLTAPNVSYQDNDQNWHTKGRIQGVLRNNPDFHEFFIRQKVFFHPELDSMTHSEDLINWFTIQEFWNNLPAEDSTFRVTLNIIKEAGLNKPLHFGAHGQSQAFDAGVGNWETVWEDEYTEMAVPLGQWLIIETHFKEGNAENGIFNVKVTDTTGTTYTVIDRIGFTHHPEEIEDLDGVTSFNPMKLYTLGELITQMNAVDACVCIYWDDFQIWKDSTDITGITEVSKPKAPFIYPNPTSYTLSINSKMPWTIANVYDLNGKKVLSMEKNASSIMNVSNLSVGIYVLRLQNFDTFIGQPIKFVRQ